MTPLSRSVRPASERSVPSRMSRYDKNLYDAWLDGFGAGYECGRDDDWPVKWILRGMYWTWRHRRKQEARRA